MFNTESTVLKVLADYGYRAMKCLAPSVKQETADPYSKELRDLNGLSIPKQSPSGVVLQT